MYLIDIFCIFLAFSLFFIHIKKQGDIFFNIFYSNRPVLPYIIYVQN